MTKSAVISPDGVYRYHLQRVWDEFLPRVCWIMLNPSTADADLDDPTIRRCIGFSKSWGYGGFDVVNLFALRSTNPANLRVHHAPVGPHNNTYIQKIVTGPDVVLTVAAWGSQASFEYEDGGFHLKGRDLEVMRMMKRLGVKLYRVGPCAAMNRPKHPLYLKSNLQPEVMMA